MAKDLDKAEDWIQKILDRDYRPIAIIFNTDNLPVYLVNCNEKTKKNRLYFRHELGELL